MHSQYYDGAGGENVAPPVDRAAHELLGGHEHWRAHQLALRVGQGHASDFRDPEVGPPGSSVATDQDVRRLDVPMHDAVAVGVVDDFRGLDRDLETAEQRRCWRVASSRTVSPSTYSITIAGRPRWSSMTS